MNNNDLFVITDVSPEKLNSLVKNIMKQTGTADPNEAIRMVNAGEVKISVIKPKRAIRDSLLLGVFFMPWCRPIKVSGSYPGPGEHFGPL